MNELSDSIKRLREALRERYKMTNLTTQDVVHVEFKSAVLFPEAIQTINKLVELVAEMRDKLATTKQHHYYCEDGWYSCPLAEDGCYNEAIPKDECQCGADKFNATIDDALTKADALLSGLKEGV